MRRSLAPFAMGVLTGVLTLTACGGGGNGHASAPTTSAFPPAGTTSPTGSTSTETSLSVPSSTSSTTPGSLPPPTTRCATLAIPSTPLTTPKTQQPALLTAVKVARVDCRDRVTFDFTGKGTAAPSCSVGYQSGPFTQDASGAPISVAGAAFLVLHCFPAYGTDFETGRTTYNGPKSIGAGAATHVERVVESGDNEGELSWVIGLDARRPFTLTGVGAPSKAILIWIS